jgi:hypothetical protein
MKKFIFTPALQLAAPAAFIKENWNVPNTVNKRCGCCKLQSRRENKFFPGAPSMTGEPDRR